MTILALARFPITTVLVIGLAKGAIYAITALGLSLVYKASRVLNFAQGEIGTLAAFVAWEVVVRSHDSWSLAIPAALGAAVGVGYLMHRFVAQPMRAASRVSVMMATLGVAFLLFGFEVKVFGPSPEILPPPVKVLRGTYPLLGHLNWHGFAIGHFLLTPIYLLALVTAAIAAGLLALVLRGTRFGLGVLASSQDPDTARLLGVPAHRVSAFTWMVGGLLGGIAGLLIAPTQGVFYAFQISGFLLFRGLVAAFVGGLGSLTGAVIGGIVVGELEAASTQVFIHSAGLPEIVLLVLVLGVMLVRPTGLFQKAALA